MEGWNEGERAILVIFFKKLRPDSKKIYPLNNNEERYKSFDSFLINQK